MTRILVPSGALGLGYDAAALKRGIEARPDLIAIDGGSTDSGPYYLGKGVSKYARASTKAEWSGLIEARAQAGVPLVLGTAGTCGTGGMVDWMVAITREVLREKGLRAQVAALKSDQTREDVRTALAEDRIVPLQPASVISPDVIDACTNIVALAGAEQIGEALSTGADIVIAGRATDTAIISALPLMRGENPGAAWHAAKVGECGALCAAAGPQSGVIQLDVDDSGFTVAPLADGAWATPQSVFAHMLYENSDPFQLFEPGGRLDVRGAPLRVRRGGRGPGDRIRVDSIAYLHCQAGRGSDVRPPVSAPGPASGCAVRGELGPMVQRDTRALCPAGNGADGHCPGAVFH